MVVDKLDYLDIVIYIGIKEVKFRVEKVLVEKCIRVISGRYRYRYSFRMHIEDFKDVHSELRSGSIFIKQGGRLEKVCLCSPFKVDKYAEIRLISEVCYYE